MIILFIYLSGSGTPIAIYEDTATCWQSASALNATGHVADCRVATLGTPSGAPVVSQRPMPNPMRE